MLASSRATNILLVLMLAVGIGIVAMLATGVRGGPLDPASEPAPTLRPLDEVQAAWNIKLPADDGIDECHSSRFECVFDDSAVLDRETGLVWERFVQTGANPFGNARLFCLISSTGDRFGWRLPTTSELTSLMVPSGSTPPLLPEGHPFEDVHPTDAYWTSTLQVASADSRSRDLVFFDGGVGAAAETGDTARYWCVRGGEGQLD